MKNTPITDFSELSSFIINTEHPTILAFTIPNSFGFFWLKRIEKNINQIFDADITFNIIPSEKQDELAILTNKGGGPVIFFIYDRKIITKSLGRISESDFMERLDKVYIASQAA